MSLKQRYNLPRELVSAVFKANTAKLPAYVGLQNNLTGYVLVRVNAVKEVAEIDANKRNNYLQQLQRISGEELLRAYSEDAKKSADISMKPFADAEKK